MRALAVSAVVALALTGCGEEPRVKSVRTGPSADQAFLQAMVPHHEAAVAMSRVALERAEHPELRQLAGEMGGTQLGEIERMRSIHQRLVGEPLRPDESAHEVLGLSAEEAGMGHAHGPAALEGAEPFDRAFIDAMTAHHQGAIRMAEAVAYRTDDDQLLALARDIVREQRREISLMQKWRERWYGQSTAGPADGGHAAGHPVE